MGSPTKAKHHLIAAVIRLILPAIKLTPRPLLLASGRVLGSIIFRLSSRERTKIADNLAIGMADASAEQRHAIATKCLSHFVAMILDTLHCTPARLNALFHPGTLERIRATLAQHEGALIMTPHLGNWELGAAAIQQLGFETHPIAKRIKMTPLNAIVERVRLSFGLRALYQDENIRSFVGVLKAGNFIGILPDQDIPRMNGVFATFLGARAHSPTGPVTLAALSGKPIIPVACVLRDKKYDWLIGEPIYVDKKARREGKINYYTQCWSDTLTGFIRQYPEQWVWMHRRWRTQESEQDKEAEEAHGQQE